MKNINYDHHKTHRTGRHAVDVFCSLSLLLRCVFCISLSWPPNIVIPGRVWSGMIVIGDVTVMSAFYSCQTAAYCVDFLTIVVLEESLVFMFCFLVSFVILCDILHRSISSQMATTATTLLMIVFFLLAFYFICSLFSAFLPLS